MQVNTNYKPYYVNQESKDNKKHIQFQTKCNLVTANHYSVCNCNKTGTYRFKGGKVIGKLTSISLKITSNHHIKKQKVKTKLRKQFPILENGTSKSFRI